MFRKTFIPLTIFVLLALAAAGSPSLVHAGGVCGGTWVAEAGDTVEKLAATCGTTTEAIYAANPGISNVLKVGQVLTIPGLPAPGAPATPTPTTTQPAPTTVTASYIAQHGDTFFLIAKRFGLSLNQLWAANPQIKDINLIYVGQVIYIPASSHPVTPVSPKEVGSLSWGSVPKNAPHGSITLTNKSEMDAYVSLQSTRADGTLIIREYPVRKTMKVEMPSGWLVYVVWVGGEKYSGAFQLRGDSSHTITINKNKVVVD